MTHFYQYFGIILGCDEPSFPKYAGNPSQAAVHRYMDLKAPEMHYFIHNIYDAALTLGVAGPDLITHVGDAISIGVGLDNIFNKKCSPPQQVATYQPSAPQSMCHDNAYVLFLPLLFRERVYLISSLTRASLFLQHLSSMGFSKRHLCAVQSARVRRDACTCWAGGAFGELVQFS